MKNIKEMDLKELKLYLEDLKKQKCGWSGSLVRQAVAYRIREMEENGTNHMS